MPKSEDFDTTTPPPATPAGALTPAQKLAALKAGSTTTASTPVVDPNATAASTPAASGFGAPASSGFGAPAAGGFGSTSSSGFGAPAAGGFGSSPMGGGFGSSPMGGGFGSSPMGGMSGQQGMNNGMGTMNNASTGNTMAQAATADAATIAGGVDSTVANDNTDWLNKKWRPMMGWVYMGTCTFDFVIAPILWSILQATYHGTVTSQWQPLTLQGAGLYHVAMGAVLGLTAYGRTKEKIAGAA